MNQEFLDLYNRELRHFTEHSKEFAEEFPGIAERLGGLVGDRMDPMIGGLLEGAAFLAARVQLKLKHEFPEFTNNLIEQLLPNFLAPTPSALLAGVRPPYPDPALREGVRVRRGSYLDATYLERDRRIACRYRLTSDVTLWPFDLTSADYIAAPAGLQALGLPTDGRALAGLRLSLRHRTMAKAEDEPDATDPARQPASWFAGCKCRDLTIHLAGGEADAFALYEQVFGDCVGIYFRHLDAFGDPVITTASEVRLEQIGFSEPEALLPADTRVFRGFDLLRELFWFPRKFLGFRLEGLAAVMPKLEARAVDIIIVFDETNARLAAAVKREMFALYAAPAVNLFEKTTDRIPVRSNEHEYQVVPDRAGRSTTSRTAFSTSTPIMSAGARSSRSIRSIPRLTAPRRRMACFTRSAGCRAGAHRPSAGRAGRRTTPVPRCSSRFTSRRRSVRRVGVGAQRAGAMLQPPSDRASAGRGRRRGFPPARFDRARHRLHRGADAAARACRRPAQVAVGNRRHRLGDLAADQPAQPEPTRACPAWRGPEW